MKAVGGKTIFPWAWRAPIFLIVVACNATAFWQPLRRRSLQLHERTALGSRYTKEREPPCQSRPLAAESNSMILSIDEESWEHEVVQCLSPVMAFFTAPWCGPCRLVTPTIEEINEEFGQPLKDSKTGEGQKSEDQDMSGYLKVVMIDTDQMLPDMPEKLGVNSIPTLLLMKDGVVLDRVVGAVPKSTLLTMLRNKFDGLNIAGTA